jgi:two-component system OmpR family sensor kinase
MSTARGTPAAPWSLQRRLRRQLLGVLVGCWLAGSGLTLAGLWHETAEVRDSALAETAQRMLALPEAAFGPPGEPLAAGVGEHEEFVVYQVFDRGGALRLRSHAAPALPLDEGAADGVRARGDWRVLTLTRDDGARRAQVAELRAHRRKALWASIGWIGGTLLALLPLAALATGAVLARGFATLRPLQQELSARAAGELHPLAARATPQELAPLVHTIDALLARVRTLLEAERHFAAQAAHELRTPLAAARAQAQRLLAAAPPPLPDAPEPTQRAQAQALLRQLDRLTALSQRLLQLARIDAGVALQRAPVALPLLARVVADEFAPALRDGRLSLDVDEDTPAVEGDIDALGIALRNLLDNAFSHGAPPVQLRVAPGLLEVADAGPGVDPALLPTLRQRFARAPRPQGADRGADRPDSAGLGLALVDTIARQSGAELELASREQDGRGFRATLRFSPGGAALRA